MARKYLTELSLIIVAVIWALNFSIIKVTLEEIGPFAFNALRFVFAAGLLIAVTKWRGFKVIVKKEHLIPVIGIGLVGNLVYQVLFIVGVNLTNAANSAVILGTIPVWIALMAHLFTDEKLSTTKTLGITFAFIGVGLIIFGRSSGFSFSSTSALGDVIVLLSAVAWAAYTILSKKYLKEYNSTQYSAFISLIGVIALVFVGIPDLLKTDFSGISLVGYGGILYSGFLSVGLAYLIWNRGVHKIGAVRTAAYQNLVPVLGVVFGVVLLNESLNLLQYLGSGSVLAGIYLSRI
ncbi:MAG: DMT family transporter [Balneolaceae bacterium]|nr:DMT family transporter [Balneolaceae bacterium]